MIRRVLAGIVGTLALGLMPGQALAADSGEFRWGYQDHYRCVWHCEVRGPFFRPPARPTPKPAKVPKPPPKTPLTTGTDRHYGWYWDDCRLRDGGWYWHHDWCWDDPWSWHGPLPWPDPWDHHGWYRPPRYGHDRGRDSGGSGYNSHRHHPRGREF